MQIKTYYRNQLEVSGVINEIIDAYFQNKLQEKKMEEYISKIIINNTSKIIKSDGDFTTIIKQKCGKKRLFVVQRIITKYKDGKRNDS